MALITACSVDPCSSFGGQTCIAVNVQGSLSLDQLLVTTSFGLHDAPSPQAPRVNPVTPPLALAVLAGSNIGDYTLSVRALLGGFDVGFAQGGGKLTAGQTTTLNLTLQSVGVDGGGDLA